ncbi:MAG TPA: hypothetical protein VNO83_17105 [Pseudonocardia sp.]|nr:hypothetical protein [Pseudonocardia sp.]
MDIAHRLQVSSHPGGLLYECTDGCGRRLVVDRTTGALTVIDKGDQWAMHSGSIGDVRLSVTGIKSG